MTDYTELVKALRCKRDDCEGCDLAFLDKDEGWMCQYAAKDDDAADAIEALQAEIKRLKEANDELREAQTYIDHYGDKWLTSAKDVPTSAYNHGYMDGKNEAEQLQIPKHGEWKITTERFTPELICSECGVHIPCVAGWCMDAHMKYCPNCGAKMEVQE